MLCRTLFVTKQSGRWKGKGDRDRVVDARKKYGKKNEKLTTDLLGDRLTPVGSHNWLTQIFQIPHERKRLAALLVYVRLFFVLLEHAGGCVGVPT